jgi:hypothetical protein
MLQSGAQDFEDRLGSYGENRLKFYGDKLGLLQEFSVIGGVYYVYKHQEISLHYKNIQFYLKEDSLSATIKLDSLWSLVE